MKKEFICISCPVGCMLSVEEKDDAVVVSGNACARGKTYGVKEYQAPERMVTSSIVVRGGIRPLTPCKTASPVPKEAVPQVLNAIRHASADAPVALGQVLIPDVAGTGVAVIATRGDALA
jgi:CxxC motif-containing protein